MVVCGLARLSGVKIELAWRCEWFSCPQHLEYYYNLCLIVRNERWSCTEHARGAGDGSRTASKSSCWPAEAGKTVNAQQGGPLRHFNASGHV